MTETRVTAYGNAAGLLRRLGFAARCEPGYVPPPGYPRRDPVPALITDASPVLVGYAVAMVAEEPEAHLPELSHRAGRAAPGKAGDPQSAWWADRP